MMSDADNPIGYAGAVDAYRQAGWIGVLPMDRGAKKWPPTIKCDAARRKVPGHNKDACGDCISYTGHSGIDPSGADIAAWSEQYRDGNLCLRMPDGVIGIDVDDYGAKTGARALAEAVRRWGPLPEAPISTSRLDEPISGIRLFRVPPGTMLEPGIGFDELGIGDIEICQHHHRYVIAWPSVHPEGREYWWINEARQLIGIPTIDELPWLPQRWIDGLKIIPKTQLNGHYNTVLTLTPGEPSLQVQQRLSQAIKELNLPGTSRHDTALRHVMALMRMGKSNQPGVKKSLQLLCDVFVASTSVDHSRSPDEARAEFVRMIDGQTAARELSAPGVNDWWQTMVTATPNPGPVETSPASPASQPTNGSAPPDHWNGGADTGADTGGDVTVQPSRPRSHLEEIEQGFWDSRESLQMIYQTALARMCPPWAVLAHTAARALVQVRPCVTLPPLIGGPGSLNWFAAVVAPSGGGKGASSAAARLLIPAYLPERNIGSGEGVITAFGKVDDTGAPEHEALLFMINEIDTLAAMNGRTASTTLSVLREAFSGETLGNAYRGHGQHIREGAYRMTLVLSAQPARVGWLLADEGGGTPQRFMWFPGTDKRISRNRPWEAGPLTLPPLTEWLGRREIAIPDEAAELILDERVKSQHGDQTALDGHALFCREKFAYALAVLDGRTNMTSEDWELSGIAADVSTYTREQMIVALQEASVMEAIDRGESRGIEQAAAEAAKTHEQVERRQRILRWLLSTIEKAGEDGMTKRDLSRKITSRDRKFLDGALDYAGASGLVRLDSESGRWIKI